MVMSEERAREVVREGSCQFCCGEGCRECEVWQAMRLLQYQRGE